MKIGIIGAGIIANKVSGILSERWSEMLYAVASRDAARAQEFAARHGVKKAYGSYEELVCDPEVGIVYVATPHSHHFAHARLALMHDKHVICEKAFTANASEAKALIELAHNRGLFLMEAMWTRFMPITQKISDVLKSGIVGRPRILNASLCWSMTEIPRIKQSNLCGGALLDLGVYCLTFAHMYMGEDIININSNVVKGGDGVDWTSTISILYADGKIANLQCSACCYDRRGIIVCEQGRIEVDAVNWPTFMKVVDKGGKVVEEYHVPADEPSGYELEFLAAKEALEKGWTEHPLMPHSSTLHIMEIMDTVRKQWQITYPNDIQ